MYVCTYVRMYVCTYVRMYVCTYVRMYVCMYVRMYVCMYVWIPSFLYCIRIREVILLKEQCSFLSFHPLLYIMSILVYVLLLNVTNVYTIFFINIHSALSR